MTSERKPFFTGCKRDVPDSRDRPLCAAPSLLPSKKLPKAASLAGSYPPVLNQGQSNSCTSNATANALRYLLRIGKHPDVAQSRLFIYWNARTKIEGQPADVDSGLQIRDAMKSVAQYNSVAEATWPFDPVPQRVFLEPSTAAFQEAAVPDKFAYESVPQTEQAIKSAIASRRPVILGIELQSSFYDVGPDGVATPMHGGVIGWHAVTIVGYNDSTRMFQLQNSWGEAWGKNGFFFLSYDYVLDPATAADLWAVKAFEDGAVAPLPVRAVLRASDGSVVKPDAAAPCHVSAAKDAAFSWNFSSVAGEPETYVLASPYDANTLLSCSQKLGVVDAFVKDDASGRQHWTFTELPSGKFTVTVEKGLDVPSEKFLTLLDGGALGLRAALPAGSNASQIFAVEH
jgi:hypothetical protein